MGKSWGERQREGGRHGGVKKGKRLGKRRRIVEVLREGETIFNAARVRFECGHEGSTYSGRSCPAIGAYGHCKKCIAPLSESYPAGGKE